MLLQGICASLSVPATRRRVLIMATAVIITMERITAHVTLDILAQAASRWTGVINSHV